MLRSSRMIAAANSSVSRRMAALSSASNCGKTCGSGATPSSSRRLSHWVTKFCDEGFALGVGQHAADLLLAGRAGSCSLPAAARANSSSSGMLLQRKYESREASSKSFELADRAAAVGGWDRPFDAEEKCGETSTAVSGDLHALLERVALLDGSIDEPREALDFVVGRRAAEGPVSSGCRFCLGGLERRERSSPGRTVNELAVRLADSPRAARSSGPSISKRVDDQIRGRGARGSSAVGIVEVVEEVGAEAAACRRASAI